MPPQKIFMQYQMARRMCRGINRTYCRKGEKKAPLFYIAYLRKSEIFSAKCSCFK